MCIQYTHQKSWKLDEGIMLIFASEKKSAITFVEGCICVIKLGQHWFRQWFIVYSAPSHYLNQYWVNINWNLNNKLQWNFSQNTKKKSSRKCIWKYRLRNGGHFVQEGNEFNAHARGGIILRSTMRTSDISWFSLPLMLQNGSQTDTRIRFAQKKASEKVISSILAANKSCQSTAGYICFEMN